MQTQKPSSKRQLFLFFIAIIGMFLGGFFYKSLFSPNTAEVTSFPSINENTTPSYNRTTTLGKVYFSSDDTIWEADGKSGKTHVGKDITTGEVLQTGKNGFLEIQLGNTSLLRIAPESKIEFRPNSKIRLIEGNLWFRAIAGQNENYSIEAGDLETSIQSTAVAVELFESGSTLTFIDSAIPNGEITFEANTLSGAIQGTLKTEESYQIKGGIGKKKKENMDRLLAQEFYAQSLKRDIIFLHQLGKNLPSATDGMLHKKIVDEMESSFPKKAEIEKFFLSSGIRDEVRQFIRYNPQYGSGHLTNTSLSDEEEFELLIDCIKDDLEYGEMKQELKRMREGQGNMTSEEREIFQNKVNSLEESIRNFESIWSEKQRKRRREYIDERTQQTQTIEATEGDSGTEGSGSTYEPRNQTGSTSADSGNNSTIIPASAWIKTVSGNATVSGSARPRN